MHFSDIPTWIYVAIVAIILGGLFWIIMHFSGGFKNFGSYPLSSTAEERRRRRRRLYGM